MAQAQSTSVVDAGEARSAAAARILAETTPLLRIPSARAVAAAACWAAGAASWAWAVAVAASGTGRTVGAVTDIYLALAVGAALLLAGTIARLPHGEQLDDGPWADVPGEARLRPAVVQSLTPTIVHSGPPLPTESSATAAGTDDGDTGRRRSAARSAEEMVAAYKRAAEKHSEQALRQQQRAETAEARNRYLETEIEGYEDGTSDAARVLYARIEAAAIVASNRRITEVTEASDRVIRALREEKALIEADRQAAREVIEGLERDHTRMLASAASGERQRIQLLVRQLVAEYARTLPPDRARLAREQAEHFISAIRELPAPETSKVGCERSSDAVVDARRG